MNVAGAYWKGRKADPPSSSELFVRGFSSTQKTSWTRICTASRKPSAATTARSATELYLFSIQEESALGCFLAPQGWLEVKDRRILAREEVLKVLRPRPTPRTSCSRPLGRPSATPLLQRHMFGSVESNKRRPAQAHELPRPHLIYKSKLLSYPRPATSPARPISSPFYRYERIGVLHCLLRVRGFTQDDAHIFLHALQIESEVEALRLFSPSP